MKQVFIKIEEKEQREYQKIEKELLWYDNIKKELLSFKGGKLNYKYKKDEYLEKLGYKNPYRLLPEIEEIKEPINKKVNNTDKINKFILSYNNYNDEILSSFVEGDSVICEINDKDIDNFTGELDRNNFLWNY